MARFSERNGHTDPKGIQIDCVDIDLRNALWNIIYEKMLWHAGYSYGDPSEFIDDKIKKLFHKIWVSFLKKTIDEIPEARNGMNQLKVQFQNCEWYNVYDLLEMISQNLSGNTKDDFIKKCNVALQEHNSGYRFTGSTITSIIDEFQRSAVEEALNSESISAQHIKKALILLSDRQKPDFENSIKESISAVEFELRTLLKEPNEVASKLLDKLKQKNTNLHPAFIESINKLYSFASDAGGIRHSMKNNGSIVFFEDALCMAIICSALVNRLRVLKITF